MTPHWLAMLSCVALAALAHGATVPTTDTLVVTTETNDQTQDTISFEDFRTSSPPPPIKLTSMDVRSEVRLRYAHTAVVARVRNPARVAQEAAFRMLLPEAAFISGFTMVLNDKSYEAYVKEKEEAKQIFNDAVSSGSAAAHIATKARDSNHFTVSVNVEPNTTAEFRLTYEELLPRRNGVYNHAVNLHPGALVPSLTVTVHIKESQKITALRVPEVRTGNEIDATEVDPQNTKAVIERSGDGREATITFRPDLEEQRNLRNIYAMKTRQGQSADGVLGQFVVQYDVERSDQGEVLINDGYFVHFFAPSTLLPLSKHVVFVLDTSYSMHGGKMEQLQEAMNTILSELNQGDYFTLLSFASSVKVHNLAHVTTESPKAYPATPEYIAKAKTVVNGLVVGGGTNICSALEEGIDIIQRGVDGKPIDTNSTTVSMNTLEYKNLEPIIIFLTDGQPVVGVIDKNVIVNRVSEKNAGPRKASIYALAFGEDADREFLRKLSLRNEGFMRHIYEAADAALQLRDFYRQVASPLLANVHFVYPEEQIKQDSVTKQVFRTLYAGSEVVVAGRCEGKAFSPLVYGERGVRTVDDRERYEVSSPVSRGSEQSLPLERLWAYLTVQQLLDARDAADEKAGAAKKALDIALKYSFVTPLTSLVVVKPNATNAVHAESVDMQTSTATPSRSRPAAGVPGQNYHSNHRSPSIATPPRSRPAAGVPGQNYNSNNSYHLMRAHSAYSAHSNQKRIGRRRYNNARASIATPSRSRPAAAAGVPGQNYNSNNSYHLMRAHSAYSAHSNQKRIGRRRYNNARASIATPPPRSRPAAGVPGQNYNSNNRYHLMRANSVAHSAESAPKRIERHRYNNAHGWSSRSEKPYWETSNRRGSYSRIWRPHKELEPYHLQDCEWLQKLKVNDSDTIIVPGNGTRLTLTTDSEAPRESGGDAECARATDLTRGLCVYLTRCSMTPDIKAFNYEVTFCVVNNKFAGICCPRSNVDVKKRKNDN